MPEFNIYIPLSVLKDLARVPTPWRERVREALDALPRDPFYGQKMWGKHEGKYKIRVWPYRIIYRVNKEIKLIEVLEVGHRGGMSYK